VGDVIGVRISGHVIGDGSVGTRYSYRFAAKCLGEPQGVGNAIPLFFGELQAAAAFDVKRGQGSVQAIREPLGVTDKTSRALVLADADQNALACRPWSANGARLHLCEQLLVDPFG